jgi:hypothetical protein
MLVTCCNHARVWFVVFGALIFFGWACGSLRIVFVFEGAAEICLAVGLTLAEVAYRRKVKEKIKRFALRNTGCVQKARLCFKY